MPNFQRALPLALVKSDSFALEAAVGLALQARQLAHGRSKHVVVEQIERGESLDDACVRRDHVVLCGPVAAGKVEAESARGGDWRRKVVVDGYEARLLPCGSINLVAEAVVVILLLRKVAAEAMNRHAAVGPQVVCPRRGHFEQARKAHAVERVGQVEEVEAVAQAHEGAERRAHDALELHHLQSVATESLCDEQAGILRLSQLRQQGHKHADLVARLLDHLLVQHVRLFHS